MGRTGLGSSRSEFLSADALDGDIQYKRSGGCFVTTKRAVVLLIFALTCMITVGSLVYIYGPKNAKDDSSDVNDLEKLLNASKKTIPDEDFRLPDNLVPLHYRLRLRPIMDEQNFTFEGKVTIKIRCVKATKTIVLNAENLDFLDSDVRVSTTKLSSLDSLSLVLDDSDLENKTRLDQPILNNGNNVQIQPKIPPSVVNSSQLNLPVVPITKNHSNVPIGGHISNVTNNTAEEQSKNPQINNSSSIGNKTHEDAPQQPQVEIKKPISSSPDKDLINAKSVYEMSKIIAIDVKSIERDVNNSRLVIHLMTPLEPGTNITVDVTFSGKILNNLGGLYRTSYKDASGQQKWLVTTYFQPISARKVFPCFDEPSFKATFEISIARRMNMIALSNMPLKETQAMSNNTGWVWDHFEPSLPMSTYIVGFTVSDFVNFNVSSTLIGPAFNVWTPKNFIARSKYAMEVGPKILTFLESYFDVKYPLPKIDLLAIPDFSERAMESWGLISFRDTSLLLDPRSDSFETKNHIFEVIAHEFSHQWFGNLVTMKWWSGLWISEGLATLMQEVAKHALEPNSEISNILATQSMLDIDSLKSTHRLHVNITNPLEIEQIFDPVTQQKGSCLLRMLNFTLTERVFKTGLQHFLKTWSYKTATQEDLWDSFTISANGTRVLPSDLTVSEVMNSWTKQEGYPLISVIKNYTASKATICQKKLGQNDTNSLWYVPLNFMAGNNRIVQKLWLKKEPCLSVDSLVKTSNNTWILFNIDQTGFYRVNYDPTNWKLLQQQLEKDFNQIPVLNRAQILSDAFKLAEMDIVDYEIAFGLISYLGRNEKHYVPWMSALTSLDFIKLILSNTQHNGVFQDYILNLIKTISSDLGFTEKPEDTQSDKLLRPLIIKMSCEMGHQPCLEWAKRKYDEWMNSQDPDTNNPIRYENRETIQCSAISMGGQKEWNFLWERTNSPLASPADLKVSYLSLGCTRDPWLIIRYLENSLNGSIPLQNIPLIWKSLSHPVGLEVGFKFLRQNWNRIYSSYKNVFSVLRGIVEEFFSKLSTQTDLEDLTLFYKKYQNNLKSVSSLMLSAVDKIKLKINWTEKHSDVVVKWMLDRNRQ